MSYDFKPLAVDVPKEKPNNRSILQAKFAAEQLTGANDKKSPDRAVRLGELLQTGLFELDSSGIAVPKGTVDETAAALTVNRCNNGRFRLWQRNVSGAFAGGAEARYIADRWVSLSIALNMVVAPVALTGSELVEFGLFAHRTTVSSTVGGSPPAAFAGQKIEGVDSIVGRLAVDAGLRSPSGVRKVGVRVICNYGAGGSPEQVFELPKVVDIGTSMKRYRWEFELPSLSGKTIGKGSFIYVIFDYCGGGYGGVQTAQLGVFDLADVHYSVASAQTLLALPDPIELLVCQRYYEKSYDLDVVPGTGGGATGAGARGARGFYVYGINSVGHAAGNHHTFAVHKRALPAVVPYSAFTGAPGKVYSYVGDTDLNANVSFIGEGGFFLYSSVSASADNANIYWQFTADAEL